MSKRIIQVASGLVLLLMSIIISGCVSVSNSNNWRGSDIDYSNLGEALKSERTLEGFEAVDASSALLLEIYPGETQRVVVTSPSKERAKDLITKVSGGVLYIHEDDKTPIDLKKGCHLVQVYLPQLTRVDLSGAVKGKVLGHLEQEKLSLDLSGSTSLTLTELLKLKQLKSKCSGASKLTTALEVEHLDISLSGASSASLKGKLVSMSADLSGASKLDGSVLTVQQGNFELSGASSANAEVVQELKVSCSGASKLVYGGSPKLSYINTSGASSIKTR